MSIFLPMQMAKVDKFCSKMKVKLIKNKHKGHWGQENVEYLLRRLDEEIVELSDAISTGMPPNEIANEAVDVANFAMMIADHYNEL